MRNTTNANVVNEFLSGKDVQRAVEAAAGRHGVALADLPSDAQAMLAQARQLGDLIQQLDAQVRTGGPTVTTQFTVKASPALTELGRAQRELVRLLAGVEKALAKREIELYPYPWARPSRRAAE